MALYRDGVNITKLLKCVKFTVFMVDDQADQEYGIYFVVHSITLVGRKKITEIKFNLRNVI